MSTTALPAPQPPAEHRHLCGPPERVADEITALSRDGWAFGDRPRERRHGAWCLDAYRTS